MFRRRARLTAQEKADRKWERMASQPRTMGMVGIFNDLNPGAKHAEAQIIHERETFADQDAEGSSGESVGADVPTMATVDPRSPSGSGKGSVTISLTAKPQTPTVSKPKPEAD